jgi:hypothetical protein
VYFIAGAFILKKSLLLFISFLVSGDCAKEF